VGEKQLNVSPTVAAPTLKEFRIEMRELLTTGTEGVVCDIAYRSNTERGERREEARALRRCRPAMASVAEGMRRVGQGGGGRAQKPRGGGLSARSPGGRRNV
jgi:hypothetical protein